MILDILPLAGGTARLVRVYGGEPCVKLPGAVPAPEGEGQWPITELGDYCFSEKPRGLPGPEKICRYERAEDGRLCLTRAFGRDVSGKERYSFDFAAPAAPAQDDELHPICGNFLEEVTLPDSLRVIGSCTFYNCRRLRRLTAGTGELTMGSDVFLNCFALEDLVIRATPEQATGLFALVGSITEAVRALFWPVGEAAPRAGLWYPAYWEDIEETPAHILLHTFSGQGYHYRQCFLENKLLPAEYDAIFPQGHDADDAAVMAMLCQGVSLHDILTVMYSGFSADTGSDVVNSMLNRGGFTSMLSTIGLLIAAGIFGAPLRTAGVVDVLLAFVERIAKTSRSMSLGVLILHAVFFTITGAYYVSYPVVGGMVKDLYPEYHLDRKNLMRTMLDTGTGLAPMVSWSTTGSYTTTTLGVSNLAFAPFAPMLWLSIVFSVIYAVTGIGTAKAKED